MPEQVSARFSTDEAGNPLPAGWEHLPWDDLPDEPGYYTNGLVCVPHPGMFLRAKEGYVLWRAGHHHSPPCAYCEQLGAST